MSKLMRDTFLDDGPKIHFYREDAITASMLREKRMMKKDSDILLQFHRREQWNIEGTVENRKVAWMDKDTYLKTYNLKESITETKYQKFPRMVALGQIIRRNRLTIRADKDKRKYNETGNATLILCRFYSIDFSTWDTSEILFKYCTFINCNLDTLRTDSLYMPIICIDTTRNK